MPDPATTDILAQLSSSLASDRPVRHQLPDGAYVHIDRKQPFLCLHQRTSDQDQLAAARIAMASGSYVTIPQSGNRELFSTVLEALQQCQPSVLALEVAEASSGEITEDEPVLPAMAIDIGTSSSRAACATGRKIASAIEAADLKYRRPVAKLDRISDDKSAFEHFVRITIPDVYHQPDRAGIYPELLERLVASVYDAILQGVHVFAEKSGYALPAHYRAYGRSQLEKVAHHVDRKISQVCDSFDFLLSVTPINSAEAWDQFCASDYCHQPAFRYRPLTISTDEMKRQLHAIDVDAIEDPVLIKIFREKQREIDHQLTMLQLREGDGFREAGVLVYGQVSDQEYQSALGLLDGIEVDTGSNHPESEKRYDCHGIQEAAERMCATYRQQDGNFTPDIHIRDDLPAGLMVSRGNLLISRHSSVPGHRLHALLSHEIGVHLVTYFAGKAQPLKIFCNGLAGYEGVQEGLGVFAEFAVGGLTPARLKLLAGRVVACRMLLDDADFIETFRRLKNEHDFAPRAAFNLALRVYRAGGLVKDAIYLRGLQTVLDTLAEKGTLDPFWVGKIAPWHAADVSELIDRHLLKPAPVKPAFLQDETAARRIDAACNGLMPSELLAHQ